jgi:hypothetical protein
MYMEKDITETQTATCTQRTRKITKGRIIGVYLEGIATVQHVAGALHASRRSRRRVTK